MIVLELTSEAEQLLEKEATACGCSAAEFAAKLVSAHLSANRPQGTSEIFQIKDAADARAWILSRNPHLPQNPPHDTDWQQVKAEGRRY
jgi:hypothetical protein